MLEGFYKIIKEDGAVFEYKKTLFNDADFNTLLCGAEPI